MSLFDTVKFPGPGKYKFECPVCGDLVYKPKTAGLPHLRNNAVWAVMVVPEDEIPADAPVSKYGRNDVSNWTNDAEWLHNHPEHRGASPDRLCYGQPPKDKPYGVA